MTLVLGADPEFKLSGESAELFFRGEGGFGRDGCPIVCELRPRPAETARELVFNLGQMILDGFNASTRHRHLAWLAGHYKETYAIGGHIHISGLPSLRETNERRHLDKLVASLTGIYRLLSDGIDDLDEREVRDGLYGIAEPYRQKRDSWIEYRVPGSWLLSPEVAFLNIWLVEAVIKMVIAKAPVEVTRTGLDGVMEFVNKVDREIVEDKRLFIKIADRVFNKLPLAWDEDFKGAWLG